MLTLPEEFSRQISEFARVFATRKVFENAKTLVLGAILSLGRRTVCGALRSVGLDQEKRFHKYHWVLSMAEWSPRHAARIVLRMLLKTLPSSDEALVFALDETIEGRWGKRIKARGIYRNSVSSSKSHFVKKSGLRWISMMLLCPISWAGRVWALPFLTVLAPSERYHDEQGKRHKTILDWARQMVFQLRRWLPAKSIVMVGDNAYSALCFLDAVRDHVTFITRLRLDAALYEPAPARKPGQHGRPRKKGERIAKLEERLEDPNTEWVELSRFPTGIAKGLRKCAVPPARQSGTAVADRRYLFVGSCLKTPKANSTRSGCCVQIRIYTHCKSRPFSSGAGP